MNKITTTNINRKDGQAKVTGTATYAAEHQIPNLVHGKEEEGYGLDYNGILSLAVKAIQEHQCTINTLKTCLGII
jgi:CO/xanthine dehydrogenase Mo-binding subunit